MVDLSKYFHGQKFLLQIYFNRLKITRYTVSIKLVTYLGLQNELTNQNLVKTNVLGYQLLYCNFSQF